MNDDQKQLTSKTQEPFFQDELDVYEAVLALEKKYGKQILKDEQRSKLVNAGRELNSIGLNQNKISLAKTNTSHDATEVFIFALRKFVEETLVNVYNYCTIEEWNRKGADLREKVVNLFFYLMWGVREVDMRNWLNGVLGMELKHE